MPDTVAPDIPPLGGRTTRLDWKPGSRNSCKEIFPFDYNQRHATTPPPSITTAGGGVTRPPRIGQHPPPPSPRR